MEAFLRFFRLVYKPTKPGQTGNRVIDRFYLVGYLQLLLPFKRYP